MQTFDDYFDVSRAFPLVARACENVRHWRSAFAVAGKPLDDENINARGPQIVMRRE